MRSGDVQAELPHGETERVGGAVRQELGHLAVEAVGRALEHDQAARARTLRELLEFIGLLARHDRAARHAQPAHALAPLDRRLHERQLARAEHGGDVVQFEAVAQVGAIAAVALHRVGVPHARKLGRRLHATH
jgi:hypothetical protein